MDETWMMTPDPCCSMPGRNSRSRRTAASRLVSRARRQSSSPRARTPPLGALEPPETVPHLPRHLADALRGADVGLDEELHRLTFRQRRPRGGGDHRAGGRETSHDGLAHALGAARDESPLASKFRGVAGKLRLLGHQAISRRAIFPPARVKA